MNAPKTLALFLAALLASCAPGPETAPDSAPTTHEKGGGVFEEEREVYRRLGKKGVMTPDSVVVIDDEIYHGYVDRIEAPRTVHLGTRRAEYPDTQIPNQFPYLFGRTAEPERPLFLRYVAVHELAHVQSVHLNAEMGRPALGLHPRSAEVQADIIALVYLRQFYGTTRKDLGYPARVDYPFIPDRSVESLRRLYCHIIKQTWRVGEMTCSR